MIGSLLLVALLVWFIWRCLITIGRMDQQQKAMDQQQRTKNTEIAALRNALQGAIVAIDLIHMLIRNEAGVDLTDEQVASILNSAVSAGQAALGVEPDQPST